MQLERLGKFRLCDLGGVALQCLVAFLPKFCVRPKAGKRQRVPEAVLAAAAAETAARREAMRAAAVTSAWEPLLVVCASDRWERVLALDLEEAWERPGESNGKDSKDGKDGKEKAERAENGTVLEQMAPGLFRARGPLPPEPDAVSSLPPASKTVLPEGTFDHRCAWHVAGLRRFLELLTLPKPREELVEAVSAAQLNFPQGWSLEHEGPYQVRYESLAPYAQSSSYLAAALGRSISGPLVPEATEASEVARLVTVEMIGLEGLHILARDASATKQRSFNPSDFSCRWRLRPFPDYSAALEPLAALAMLGIALRLHHRRVGKEPLAFLDVTCGTGTVAAAAKYCLSSWPIFAGDINATMSSRAKVNLGTAFPGQAYELLEGASSGPSPGIGVRQWDATRPWPVPGVPGILDGEGLVIASNLPWGKSLDYQVEAATQVARCMAKQFPKATLCLIAPEEVGRNCSDWLQVMCSAPAGKKAVLIAGHGVSQYDDQKPLPACQQHDLSLVATARSYDSCGMPTSNLFCHC